MNNTSPVFLKAFELVRSLQPERPRLLTPLPDSFTPFWNHPYNVMKIILTLGEKDKTILTAAILHDVLEDTEYTTEMMIKDFGEEVTKLVMAVSKPKNYTSELASEYYVNIYQNKDILIRKGSCYIKMADRIDNMYSVAITCDKEYALKYLQETKKYYLEIAKVINCTKIYTDLIKNCEFLVSSK